MNVTLIDTLAEISGSLFLMFSDSTPLTVDASPLAMLETLKALVLIVKNIPKRFYDVYNKKGTKISGKIHQRQIPWSSSSKKYFVNFVDSQHFEITV